MAAIKNDAQRPRSTVRYHKPPFRLPHTAGGCLKWGRVAAGVAMLALMTALLVSLSWSLALRLQWVARIQIMPLALSASVVVLALWVATTLLFGRIYCSTACPLGVMQDCFTRLRRLTPRQRRRHYFRYVPGYTATRLGVFVVVISAMLFRFAVFPSLLDPYSAYSRICDNLLRPVVEWMGGREVLVASWVSFVVAVLTLAGVGLTALLRGRLYCNTLCPVGTALGALSKYSLFHFDIDTDVCVNCRACEHVCKAQCISMADHVVDGSRCVVCFNCVDACSTGAIRYTTSRKRLSLPMMQKIQTAMDASAPRPATDAPASEAHKIDRRKFLATGLLIAATPALASAARAARRVEAAGSDQVPAESRHYVAPPGRRSIRSFMNRCTGCGLCVAHCPQHVLRPSANEMGWVNALHPVMDYDASFCLYSCTRCTEICPTGALTPLTPEEKNIFVLGYARVIPQNCIGCGRCVKACPRQALRLLPRETPSPRSRKIAAVDASQCIGCGACQWICPVRPYKAIVVDGIT